MFATTTTTTGGGNGKEGKGTQWVKLFIVLRPQVHVTPRSSPRTYQHACPALLQRKAVDLAIEF